MRVDITAGIRQDGRLIIINLITRHEAVVVFETLHAAKIVSIIPHAVEQTFCIFRVVVVPALVIDMLVVPIQYGGQIDIHGLILLHIVGNFEFVGLLRTVVDGAVLYLPVAVHVLSQTRAIADVVMVRIIVLEVRLLVHDVLIDVCNGIRQIPCECQIVAIVVTVQVGLRKRIGFGFGSSRAVCPFKVLPLAVLQVELVVIVLIVSIGNSWLHVPVVSVVICRIAFPTGGSSHTRQIFQTHGSDVGCPLGIAGTQHNRIRPLLHVDGNRPLRCHSLYRTIYTDCQCSVCLREVNRELSLTGYIRIEGVSDGLVVCVLIPAEEADVVEICHRCCLGYITIVIHKTYAKAFCTGGIGNWYVGRTRQGHAIDVGCPVNIRGTA